MGLAIIMALGPTQNILILLLALGGPWAMGWHLAWQLGRLDTEDPDTCLRLFRANREAGLLPVLFLATAAIL
jgi:4-hydroxybenzoate polyprenyltransferase